MKLRRKRTDALLPLISVLFTIPVIVSSNSDFTDLVVVIITVLILLATAIYLIMMPLAKISDQTIYIYNSLFDSAEVNLNSIKSINTSGNGIYPQHLHFNTDKETIDVRVDFSLFSNNGALIRDFVIENTKFAIEHRIIDKKSIVISDKILILCSGLALAMLLLTISI